MMVQSTLQMKCEVIWSEDISHDQEFSTVKVQNPFSLVVYSPNI